MALHTDDPFLTSPPLPHERLRTAVTARRIALVKLGHEPIPVLSGRKRPALPGWESTPIDLDTVSTWADDRPGELSTGIRTSKTPGFDIDIRDPGVADQVEQALLNMCPPGPVLKRTGLAPKRLIPFRCVTPFKKMSATFKAPDGTVHKVEVLANGQQFVAEGIHESTQQPYRWAENVSLLNVAHEHLPLVDGAFARRFIAEASEIMRRAGWVEVGAKNGKAPNVTQVISAKVREIGTGSSIYGRTALRDECDKLAAMPKDSGRNNALNRAAFSLSQLVAGGELQEADVVNHLFAAAEKCGLVAEDGAASVRATIESGAKAGRGRPRQAPEHNGGDHHQNDQGDSGARPVVLLSSREFTADFTPPDYLVDGILQRRFFYSCTAMTGAGKTAWALYVAACVALGRPIGRHGVERGSVCYLAGENPTDVQMRWIAMAEHMDFDDKNIDVHFVVGKFKVEDIKAAVTVKAQEVGCKFALVFVDTSATYFPGDDENANKQAGDYARALRSLVELPGGPCVVALCHPTKNADPDNLLPRGGGAYVAEVDGNLIAKLTDTVVEVHWHGKYRGPDFDPMQFELVRPVFAARLRDSKGRPIPTVILRHLNDAEHSQVKVRMREEEDVVLGILAQADGVSLNNIAIRAGWVENGRPVKWRAQRVTDRLRDDKLVKLTRRKGWRLTDDGRKTAKSAPKPQKHP